MSRIISPGKPEWPVLLNEMHPLGAPQRLYLRGVPLTADARCIGIVGTRRPSVAGLHVAERFAGEFARRGFVVVSGLALGIDAAAHKAALNSGGATVAVLGCGVDVVYPKTNHRLFAAIAERGTLVSEYEDGTTPERWRFPARNRIIAGMCEAIVVIEGAMKSGALITARQALDANRAVFATPGSPINPRAEGANELIRLAHAGLVFEPRHVLEEIAPDLVDRPVAESSPTAAALDEPGREILGLFDGSALSLDAIVSRATIPSAETSLALVSLEMRGLLVRRHGAYELTPSGAGIVGALPTLKSPGGKT
jgi:DNA processing protein